ncbi:hypothetical protein ASPFODRAFT_53332 [Aspergillus luchuensis CBS 106.47]|uniref:Uncharacterized protein n=1 Tax=Aspergillus luchuensis (strain CBS 106.47) TaxID=1137211 RepID=A0A1M3T150_ASPLC|nr:hypothetical protein ASPFODRAFT_53332 [Aspergillus luchuensis CBS 106.47]
MVVQVRGGHLAISAGSAWAWARRKCVRLMGPRHWSIGVPSTQRYLESGSKI